MPATSSTSAARSAEGSASIRYTSFAMNLTLKARSTAGTMTSMFSATRTPKATPASVPARPSAMPCTTKTRITSRGAAPMLRRIAMSPCLPVTITTRVDTTLIAATSTISARMMNMIRLVISTAWKKLTWIRVQSVT